MKNFRNYLACLSVFALIFTSCSKDETTSGDTGEKATLSFGAIVNDLANKTSNKQSDVNDLPDCSDDAAAYVHVVLLEGNTPVVGTTAQPYRVDLVPGQIFTEEDANLELDPGTYTLDHFSVYNAAGDLLWIAPKGGVLAEFVDNALPLTIPLGAGVKKYVDVSVLCYDDRDVNQYGYQFFELDTSEWFEFCFFANYCAPDGRHYPARYSVDISVNGVPLYTDRENVVGTNGDGDRFAEALCLPLPNIADFADDEDYIDYTITLLDWDGVYDATDGQVYTGSLSRDDIEANFDGPNNIDYEHFRFGCEDNGGPGGGDCVPGTPTPGDADGDCLPDGEDPCPQVPTQNDRDGDCIPDGEDPCPDDANNECDVEEGCETAYMRGDVELNDLEYPGNNWGWAEHFMNEGDGDDYVYQIFAGAGQNDVERGDHVGNVHLTADGDNFTIVVDYFDGVEINDFHVYIGDSAPDSRAPGQFDNQDDSMTYQFTDADRMFWFIVHAEACYDASED